MTTSVTLDRIEELAGLELDRGIAQIREDEKTDHPWVRRRILRRLRNAYRHLMYWHPWSATNWRWTIGEFWRRGRTGYDWGMIAGWNTDMADLMIATLRGYRDHPDRDIGGNGFMRPLLDDVAPDSAECMALDSYTATINEIIDGFRALKILANLDYMAVFIERFEAANTHAQYAVVEAESEKLRDELQSTFEHGLDLLKEHWAGIWI